MSNLSTPAPAHKGEAKRPRYERVTYFIVPVDGGREYVVKKEGNETTFLLRAAAGNDQTTRERALEVILEDMHAPVYEAAPEQFIEAALGAPEWKYDEDIVDGDGFRFMERAARLFKEPPEPELQKVVRPVSNSFDPYCSIHKRQKHKDGHSPGSKRTPPRQKYLCPDCSAGKLPAEGARPSATEKAQTASVAAKVKKNPKCKTCHQHLRVGNRHEKADGTKTTYWKCLNGCPQKVTPDWKSWSGEELLAYVTKLLAKHNGHNPQDREDIAQEMIADLLAEKRTFAELHDPKVIRQFIKSQARHSQDKFGKDAPLSLDERVRGKEGDDSKDTYADRLKSEAPNPEEELMAKEAGAGEE
jgi:hypothetical protein